MANPHPSSHPERPDPEAPSTATQVTYWLMLVSLVVAVLLMGGWWLVVGIPVTGSMTFVLLFATIGLWVTVYRLLILGIKRLVRSRVARRTPASG